MWNKQIKFEIPDTLEIPKFVTYNGTKYALLGKGLYYLSQSTTNQGRINPKGLHVAIWEDHHGEKVQKDFHIHHKDGNTFNIDITNLECLHGSKHLKMHM